jgi:hypothetical protein
MYLRKEFGEKKVKESKEEINDEEIRNWEKKYMK